LNYRFDFYYMLCIPRFNYKRRKLIGQKVKIVGFSVKKLVALVINNTFRNYFERFAKNMRLHIISWWSLKPNLKKTCISMCLSGSNCSSFAGEAAVPYSVVGCCEVDKHSSDLLFSRKAILVVIDYQL